MRNFSFITNTVFESYTINGGEYVSDDVSITDVVKSLATAFETKLDLVMRAADEAFQGAPYSEHIAPSEYAVLVDLVEFVMYAARSVMNNGVDTTSKTFLYVNLNTGKSVAWIHHVS